MNATALDFARLIAKYDCEAPADCPNCNALGTIRVRFVGDPVTRMGYAIVYCRACRLGGMVSRLRAPDQVDLVPFGEAERLNEELADIQLLPS